MAKGTNKRGKKEPLAQEQPPHIGKTPLAVPGDDWRKRHPLWRFRFMDLDHGEWGWRSAKPDDLLAVHARLAEYERKTWKEILSMRGGKGPYNGLIAISDIAAKNPKAEKRITKFPEVAAAGSLMKLRVDGNRRVWGVMQGHVCWLFWLDPQHSVWS